MPSCDEQITLFTLKQVAMQLAKIHLRSENIDLAYEADVEDNAEV